VSLVTSGRGPITGTPILTDISFEVFQSDRVALIGPSGAGKTSLLRLLNRLSEPTAGSIYLENQDYQKIPVLQLRRQVMLVPQEPKLLGMTVQQALAYPLTLQQLPQRQIQERLDACREQLHIPGEWLERTGVTTFCGTTTASCDRACLGYPTENLITRRANVALDAGLASHVLGVLADLALKDKMAILMVNHQLDMAQLFCTRVLYLQGGQLLQDAPVAQIDWKHLRENLVKTSEQASQDWF
jgi:D-methionine transport system ATP-binding protein